MVRNEADTSGDPRNAEGEGFAVVPIPADRAEAVMRFVEELERSSDDVSGHAMFLGSFGLKQTTMKDCSSRTTAVGITDWTCKYSDSVQS